MKRYISKIFWVYIVNIRKEAAMIYLLGIVLAILVLFVPMSLISAFFKKEDYDSLTPAKK